MNMKTIVVSVALAMLGSQAALAHPDHDHPRRPPPPPAQPATIEEDAAKVRGQEELARLVSVKKLHESWKDAGRFSTIKKSGDAKKWEWLLTFDNDKVKDNKRLYIFLKPSGEFVAANFTGK